MPEQRFVLNKSEWNFREGLSVFANALIAYVTIRLIITMFLQTGNTETIEVNITTILLSQLPDIILGAYPIFYIVSKKHQSQKLGLSLNNRYLIIALVVGIIGSIGLILIDNLSSIILTAVFESGFDFFGLASSLEEQNLVLQGTDLIFIVLLMILMSLSAISIELAFRGVLHNTFKARFNKDFIGRASTILLVALIYSALFLFFTLPFGIYFFVTNFVVFLFLGLIYEVNNNLLSTIIANIIFNIVIIILIVYF